MSAPWDAPWDGCPWGHQVVRAAAHLTPMPRLTCLLCRSLLTGLYPATSGTITVNGRSLQKDLSVVRAELGVCLQRDILFDHLTVLEHLLLFASLKVLPGTHQKLREQVHRWVTPLLPPARCPMWVWAAEGDAFRASPLPVSVRRKC